MSVLIKGMGMPFTCLTCDFHKCAGGVGDFCSLTKRRQFRFKNRPKDCPLVPVPPHGRLVDARYIRGAIIQKWMDKAGDSHMYKCGMEDAYEVIRNAPTIIPAEEGE